MSKRQDRLSRVARIYRDRRVLVTGHSGFKGAWLCTWLDRLGADITGVSLPAGRADDARAQFQAPVENRWLDINQPGAVEEVVKDRAPEIVFHLAAQSLVRRSYRWPLETLTTNVIGTARVLEAIRSAPSVRAVVVVTSDKVYRNPETGATFSEEHPLGGQDPYSGSKACAEVVAALYRESYLATRGIGVATVRVGNVIGGGDWAEDRLAPDLVRAFLRGDTAALRNPAAVRPWQHVLDPLFGYLMLGAELLEGNDFASAWNFGPDPSSCVAVVELARMLAAHWPGSSMTIARDKHAPYEAPVLRLDNARARQKLGWSPVLDLSGAVAWTAEWYRQALVEGAEPLALTRGQIDRYCRLLATSAELAKGA